MLGSNEVLPIRPEALSAKRLLPTDQSMAATAEGADGHTSMRSSRRIGLG